MEALDAIALPSGDGFVLWADARRALPVSAPVRFAECEDLDTMYLLLYVWADGPGATQLLAQAPEVIRAMDVHCGRAH